MRPLPHAMIAALVAAGPPASLASLASPALAQDAATDALVATAAAIATVAPFARDAERIDVLLAAARARQRRADRAGALALLEEAARRGAVFERPAGPDDRAVALIQIALAFRAAGEPERAARLLVAAERAADHGRGADGGRSPAWREALGRALALAGHAAEAEAALAGVAAPEARALLAGAWRRARDGKRAARRAGEALAVAGGLAPAQAAAAGPGLAAALWRAGYPEEALRIAQALVPGALAHAPLIEAMAEEGAPPALREAAGRVLEAAAVSGDARLAAMAARAFAACGRHDRAAAALALAEAKLAAEPADAPAALAGHATALVAVGDPAGREGRAEAAVRAAVGIGDPYHRAMALLGIDALAPRAAAGLGEAARQALAAAARPVDGDR